MGGRGDREIKFFPKNYFLSIYFVESSSERLRIGKRGGVYVFVYIHNVFVGLGAAARCAGRVCEAGGRAQTGIYNPQFLKDLFYLLTQPAATQKPLDLHPYI